MRIGFAGCSGTGKTYLAKAVAERFGWPFNPIGARSVAEAMGFKSPYDVNRAGKRGEFQETLFKMKKKWEAEHEHFVSDRTYLDDLTYSALHMAQDLDDDAIERYARAMSRYDLVFVTPKSVFQQLDPSGVHVLRRAYHEIYEQLITGWIFNDAPCSAVELGGCARDERTAIVLKEIEHLLEKRARRERER